MKYPVLFVAGIDTDCGKTIATGLLTIPFRIAEIPVITQKMVQTGCAGTIADDILEHRKIMKKPLFPEDKNGLTSPQIFKHPSAPALAAKLEGKEVDLGKITDATNKLRQKYTVVLIEGAGGLMVPLKDNYLTIDYVVEQKYPLALVSSTKLGSINHTLLSLEAIKSRKIRLPFFIYNKFPNEDSEITADSERFFRQYLATHFPKTSFKTIEEL